MTNDLPPPEALTAERVTLVLQVLGFPVSALTPPELARAAELVPHVAPARGGFRGAWRVGDAEVWAFDPGAALSASGVYCRCGARSACAHVFALMLWQAWASPEWRRYFLASPWELALEPFLQAAPEPAPAPGDRGWAGHRGWVRYHVLPPGESGAFDLLPEVVRLSRSGDRELQPQTYPRELDTLVSRIHPVRAHDRAFHAAFTALREARGLAGKQGRGQAVVDLLVHRLLEPLSLADDVRFRGAHVRVSLEPVRPRLKVERVGDGLRLSWDPPLVAVWDDGIGLTEGGEIRPLPRDLPPRVRRGLLAPLPAVPPSDVERFVDRIATDGAVEIDLPAGIGGVRTPDSREARLVLEEQGAELVVRLAFAYERNGAVGTVAPGEPGRVLRLAGAGVLQRDPDWETAEASRFASTFGVTAQQGGALERRYTGEPALDFLCDTLPELRASWAIHGTDALSRMRVRGTLTVGVGFASGVDWFDLDTRFEIGGLRVPTTEILQSWLTGRRYHRLSDGALARLPQAWLDRHGPVLDELEEVRRAQRKLSAHDAWLASELLSQAGSEAQPWQTLAASLRSFDGVPERPVPPGLKATLRAYQRRGFEWLAFLRDHGLSGCLADDMGLGKTVQALAVLLDTHAADPEAPPSLVVAPTSVLHNWASEAERFAPGLRVRVHHGPERTRDLSGVDLVITSYALLRNDRALLHGREWTWVVLDEAQNIKNPGSQVARAARGLTARHRLALTGTPVENHLIELWSLFGFLMPGFFGSRKAFQARYAGPAWRDTDAAALTRLRRRIRPFLLRRLKREVASELPERQDVVLRCALSTQERALYRRVRDTYRATVLEQVDTQGIGRSTLHILEALTRLRQACCHPGLLPFPEAEAIGRSSKVELLVERLAHAIAGGHRSLVFSQWPSLLERVAARLEQEGWDYLVLRGDTRDRGAVVARWSDPDGPPVFLISIKAGGAGLNLTAADHVFHLDPWWNPAVEDQASDRAHRIGQDKPVVVYKLVAEDTVEEKVLELQARKRALVDATVDAGRVGIDGLTREDLEAVFGA